MNTSPVSRWLRRAALSALVASAALPACGGPNTDDVVCTDSECVEPPADFCDGNRAIQFDEVGICNPSNECVYARSAIECAFDCEEGRCVGETDPCEGVDCSVPPSPTCDGNIRVAYTGAGTCELGTCEYPEGRQNCADQGLFCVRGACTTADCADVVCDDPPDAFCDGVEAVAYGPLGSCFEGICAYNEIRIDCDSQDLSCDDGACVERCEGVVCDAPPSGFCESSIRAVSYAETGVCDTSTGGCIYAEVEVDCDPDTQACSLGRCVAVCSEGICDDPPDAFCDDEVAVSYLAESECVEGECVYSEAREDCSAEGGECLRGACTPTCGARVCNGPPSDTCEDGNVAVDYPDRGACVDETCVYSATRTDCDATGEVCDDGQCVPPCTGVVCNAPPTPFCDDDTRHYFVTPGTCAAGECSYEERTLACRDFGLVCVSGDCIDPCEAVFCDDAPADACEGAIALEYPFIGDCSFGDCYYDPNRVDCRVIGEACLDGLCTDLCEGVDCSVAPDSYCDGSTAVRYANAGVCREGECDFTVSEENCAVRGLVCRDGLCRQPCFGVTCDEPPGPFCDGVIAVKYNPGGTCSGGACSYAEDRTNCGAAGLSCVAGECVNLCDGQVCYTPPASTCDGNTAVRFAFVGQCVDGGECEYPQSREDCDLTDSICVEGTCVNTCDEGCSTPPESTCDGNVRVRYAASGTCDAGVCNYTETRFDCTTGGELCRDGACFDPCENLACSSPPLAFCDGATAVRFEAPGTCAFGVCDYDEVRRNCGAEGLLCSGGVCASACGTADDCTAPSPFCDGDTLVTAVGDASCAGGACVYARERFDCTSIGEQCSSGACTDLCNGVDCSSAPRPSDVCDGNVAIDYDSSAVCVLGECRFGSARVDCDDYGTTCSDGACFDP